MKILFYTLCFSLISSFSFSQISDSQFRKELLVKGIELISEKTNYSEKDQQAILNFSFDSYRNEKSNRIIQLKNGPQIKLYSFNQLLDQHIPFDNSIYLDKKGEVINANEKPLITEVNIGLGVGSVYTPY